MVVVFFRYYRSSNSPDIINILAHSEEEAEKYLRSIEKNGIFKIQDLNILYQAVIAEPTNFSVQGRNKQGFPSLICWLDKSKGSNSIDKNGCVKHWTDYPPRIKILKALKCN